MESFDYQDPSGSSDSTDIIDTHSTMLYRFCRKLAYSKEDAEDLFQDTWYWALRKTEKLIESPQVYLCRTALNLWKSSQRKYARRKRIAPRVQMEDDIADEQSVESDFIRQEELELVQTLIRELPDRLRVPIILYYTLEMDITKIATTLDLPKGTVKSRLYVARQEIKKGFLNYEK